MGYIQSGSHAMLMIVQLISPHQRTPLHWAAERHADIAQFLVEKGADINVKDNDGVRESVLLTVY